VFLIAANEAAAGPDWAVVLTAIGTAVGATVLGTSAIVAWFQLKDAKITRHAELMVELGERWDAAYSPAIQVYGGLSDRDLFGMLERLFGDDEPEKNDLGNWLTLTRLPDLIEEIADFGRYGALSPKAIDVVWGDRIISLWLQWRPTVHRLRRILRKRKVASPNAYLDFQRLAVGLRLERRGRTRPAYRGLPAAVALAAGYTESGDFRPSDPPTA
jgi:hypothetical protein